MHDRYASQNPDWEEYPCNCRIRSIAKGVFECMDKRPCPFAMRYEKKQLCMDPFSTPQSRLEAAGMTLEFEPIVIEAR